MENIQKNDLGEQSVSIPLLQLRKLTNRLENFPDDTKISFEFVLTALFPSIFENVKKFGTEQFMKGYNEGFHDGYDKNKGNS